AVDSSVVQKRQEANNQFDFFSLLEEDDSAIDTGFGVTVPDLPEWDKKTKLAFEREMIGLYVSDHPLQGLEQVIEQHADHSVSQVLDDEGPADGSFVTISGLITSLERQATPMLGPKLKISVLPSM
ncbi:MAG: hypothetical protein L0J69_06080, partial [Yaniella sp.]|nr:hypothetical protein [Yaniella sp.]